MLPSWLIIFWSFMMGGAVGSFLNVVVYRLPLGISIVHPPSRCPKCGKGIAWYDNVPILGWIMLRGRCRQCHNPISARYPVVESIAAVMFAVVAVVEANAFEPETFLVRCPYHWLLLSTLLSAALIEYDGNRVPPKLYWPAMAVWLVAMFSLAPVVSMNKSEISPAWTILIGVLGVLAWIFIAARTSQEDYAPTAPILGLACVGLYLGWGAAFLLAAAASTCYGISRIFAHFWPKIRIPPMIFLGSLTLIWILAAACLVSS